MNGDASAAATTQLIELTRRRDLAGLLLLARGPDGAAIRRDRRARRLLVESLTRVGAFAAAAGDARALCAETGDESDCALAALCELAAGMEVDLPEGDGTSEPAGFLPGHRLLFFGARINGLAEEYFLLDTGAPTTVLRKSFCDRFAIPYLAGVRYHARDSHGNPVAMHPCVMERIEVGGLAVRNFTANVAEFPANLKIAGILSPWDVFSRLTVTIDLQRRTLQLLPEPVGEWPYRARLIWDDGNPLLRARVDGKGGLFLLDSGSGANLVTPAFAARLGHAVDRTAAIAGPTLGGSSEVWGGFEGLLAVENSPPAAAEFSVSELSSDPEVLAPIERAGYIGIPWMEERAIALPPGGTDLLFTDPDR